MVISQKLGFKSIDEYVSDIARLNVRTSSKVLETLKKKTLKK